MWIIWIWTWRILEILSSMYSSIGILMQRKDILLKQLLLQYTD